MLGSGLQLAPKFCRHLKLNPTRPQIFERHLLDQGLGNTESFGLSGISMRAIEFVGSKLLMRAMTLARTWTESFWQVA